MLADLKQRRVDAIRAGCAEAKMHMTNMIASVLDAIRAGCAEAKVKSWAKAQ